MVKAIALCRRRSTGSVLQLEIPPDIMAEATNIANKTDTLGIEGLETKGELDERTESSDHDESVTMYLLQYIAHNCPNAGDWDVQAEPLFTIVNNGDDLDTIEDKHYYNKDIEMFEKYIDISEDLDDDELYLGDTE